MSLEVDVQGTQEAGGDSGSGRAADLRCREARLHMGTVPRVSGDL